MGSKSPTYTAPTPPSVTSSISDLISNTPQLVELQKQYAPELAQLEYDIQQKLYPQQAQLGENLAQTATEGMSSSLPDWMKQEYLSNMRANLGENSKSMIGSDYLSRGLMQQGEDWKRYYQNMGMSLSNKVPMAQSNYSPTQSFTPSSVMNYNASTYSPYMSGWSNAQQLNQQSPAWMNMLGSLGGAALGGLGNMGSMGMYGYMTRKP